MLGGRTSSCSKLSMKELLSLGMEEISGKLISILNCRFFAGGLRACDPPGGLSEFVAQRCSSMDHNSRNKEKEEPHY